MVTRAPISTISYNTYDFLVAELIKLQNERIIEFWAFVEHKPEDDETKAHKHLLIFPATTIDTFDLSKRFEEIDIEHPDLPPLGCIMWHRSKFVDWYLYALHDADYLASKGQSRKYHYEKCDVACPDNDYLNEQIHLCDFSPFKRFSEFRDCVKSKVPFAELVKNGFVPIPQIYQWSKAYYLLSCDRTYRNGREGHEEPHYSDDYIKNCLRGCEQIPFVFDENGEIIDFDN